MSVSHASLSGASLHEPKGIEDATSGQIYVADGANSGAWTDSVSLDSPFTSKFFHAYSNAAQTLTNGTWNTLTFTTEVTDDLGITISSGNIPLAAGTYWITASLPWYGATVTGQLKFYNNTNSTDLIVGHHNRPAQGLSAGTVSTFSTCAGRVVLADTKTCSLRFKSTGTATMIPNTAGFDTYVYTQLYIWKIA